ncbi:MAG: UDP-N-acetylmuramyl-tripeptide synthetase [Eubacteriales bacterium]|nr:UDP-N-acetylmuramyl-tripeptide synthetase [Eubacteriales bacterium]MDY3332759.1 UDP-N-acetylmuramyl-tripeptide synthetase [Gallibacter sp.]
MMRCSEFIIELDRYNLVEFADNNINDLEILDITFNSIEVSKQTAFFCKGESFKEEYLEDAIKRGAILYISEKKYSVDLPCIIVKDVRRAMLVLASLFFGRPDEKLKIVAVTGTKGKSTTVMFLKHALDKCLVDENKKPVGLISSILTYDGKNSYESSLTTPEAIPLYRNLYNAVQSGLKYMIVEVSSQALKYDRIGMLDCDVVCILNIDRDHISDNEHPTLEDYIESKLKILSLSDNVVYYLDTEYLDKINEIAIARNMQIKTFSIQNEKADYYAVDKGLNNGKTEFSYRGKVYRLNTFGSYNIENAMCTLAVSEIFGFNAEYILEALDGVDVDGRSNLYMTEDGNIIGLVDYAHNELSFEKALSSLRKSFSEYKIYSVFGATGNKAKNRRVDLPRAASKYSDFIAIVPDDPNFEQYEDIAKIMIENIDGVEYKVYNTRKEAIEEIFNSSEDKKVLFLAGKGHEGFQKINGQLIPIQTDAEVFKECAEINNNK